MAHVYFFFFHFWLTLYHLHIRLLISPRCISFDILMRHMRLNFLKFLRTLCAQDVWCHNGIIVAKHISVFHWDELVIVSFFAHTYYYFSLLIRLNIIPYDSTMKAVLRKRARPDIIQLLIGGYFSSLIVFLFWRAGWAHIRIVYVMLLGGGESCIWPLDITAERVFNFSHMRCVCFCPNASREMSSVIHLLSSRLDVQRAC